MRKVARSTRFLQVWPEIQKAAATAAGNNVDRHRPGRLSTWQDVIGPTGAAGVPAYARLTPRSRPGKAPACFQPAFGAAHPGSRQFFFSSRGINQSPAADVVTGSHAPDPQRPRCATRLRCCAGLTSSQVSGPVDLPPPKHKLLSADVPPCGPGSPCLTCEAGVRTAPARQPPDWILIS